MDILTKEDIKEITDIETPRGQILTSKWKKYVYIPNKGKFMGYVFKGPWEKDSEKIRISKYRTKIMEMLDAEVLYPEFIQDYEDNIWLKFRNMATIEASKWITENTSGKLEVTPIKIINRESLGYKQLSKCTIEEHGKLLFGKSMFFRNYILMALLGIGDMGPWNTLIVEEKGYIIDYEDNSARKKIIHPKDFFSKTNNKYLINILSEGFESNLHYFMTYILVLRSKIKMIQKIADDNHININIYNNYLVILDFMLQYNFSLDDLIYFAIDNNIKVTSEDTNNTIKEKMRKLDG